MASDYTTNFNLDKYVGTDKPNLRDQYNSAMDKIDAQLKISSDNAALAVQTANNAASAVSDKASQSDLNALAAIIPSTDFSASSTVKSAIDAKGTAISNEATARQNADNNLSSRITALETKKHMVVIADSFSSTTYQPAATAWYTLVAQQLHVTPHCYAKDSAGFVHVGAGNNTFYSELNLANNDTSFSNDDVEWVFIYGGLNDMNATDYGSFLDNCKNTINRANALFVNAKIVVMGVNSWPNSLNKFTFNGNQVNQINGEFNIRELQHYTSCAPFAFIPMCFSLGFRTDWYDTSNSHPNANGHRVVANMVLDALFGTVKREYGAFNVSFLDASNNVVGSGSMTQISSNSLNFQGNINFGSSQIAVHDSRNIVPVQGLTWGSGKPIIFGSGTGFIASTNFNPNGNTGTGYFDSIIVW